MKSHVQIVLAILMISGLVLSFVNTAKADDDPGETYEGIVSTNLLDATKSIPGGGYAWAQTQIGWTPLRTDGVAKTGLSSGVTGTYSVCSKVDGVYKNGNAKGGTTQVCASKTGGGQVTKTKQVFEIPYGNTWRADTSHGVSAGSFSWWPSSTLTYTIPWP